MPHKVKKRDGSVVPFEKEKIRYAIEKSLGMHRTTKLVILAGG